jgi:hypothetical protein
MKKNKIIVAVAAFLSCSFLFSSCIGSFALTNKILDWNKSVGDKYVSEIVFICFNILPVYEITVFADAVIFNSLEFWNQENPIAANTVKHVQGEKGNYKIESNQAGYRITNESTKEVIKLTFNKNTNSWAVNSKGKTVTFMTFIDSNHVKMFGSDEVIELSQTGALSYQAAVNASLSYACR